MAVINGTGISTSIGSIFMILVLKYTIPMDPMGWSLLIKTILQVKYPLRKYLDRKHRDILWFHLPPIWLPFSDPCWGRDSPNWTRLSCGSVICLHFSIAVYMHHQQGADGVFVYLVGWSMGSQDGSTYTWWVKKWNSYFTYFCSGYNPVILPGTSPRRFSNCQNFRLLWVFKRSRICELAS